jgi:hypothetical protein
MSKPLTPDELPPLSNPPTPQEVFNRAYLGLKSQDFTRCTNPRGGCVMVDDAGRHCAIGWVDPTLGEAAMIPKELRHTMADAAGLLFIDLLMEAHDNPVGNMETRLRQFAAHYKLTVPGDTQETSNV